MCILPADVTKVKCLFFNKLIDLLSSDLYGIECSTPTSLDDVKNILRHYEFQCFSDDYIRNLVIDEGSTVTLCTTKDVFTAGTPS
jgi:hypothetical protein